LLLAKFILVSAGSNLSKLTCSAFYGGAALLGLGIISGLFRGFPIIVLIVFAFLFTVFLVVPIREHIIQVRIKKSLKTIKTTLGKLRKRK